MKRERRKCEGNFRVDGKVQQILWTDGVQQILWQQSWWTGQQKFWIDWQKQQDFRCDKKELQLLTDELYFLTDGKQYFRLEEELKLEDHVGWVCYWKELVEMMFGRVGLYFLTDGSVFSAG
ncbi:hypothetical protein FCV25MIE_25879 [Fagus crenata]